MDLMIFSSCTPPTNCDGTKVSKGKQGNQGESVKFEDVLQQEETKMSSEAEALMLAMLQKPQTTPTLEVGTVETTEQGVVSVETAEQGTPLMPEVLVETGLKAALKTEGQVFSADEQSDVVGTSQVVETEAQKTEVNFQELTKTSESAEMVKSTAPETEPINFEELGLDAETQDDIKIDPKILKTAAENKQQVDQAVKPVVDPQGTQSIKTESVQQEPVVVQEAAEPQTVDGADIETDQTKLQFDQVMKSTTTNEPARMAEAQPRQTINQISEQIEMLFHQGKSALRLQLNPNELGRIDIRLVNTGQGLNVTVFAEQAETGRLLEAQLDQLKQTLQDAGIQLSNLNVGHQSQGKRNGWFVQDEKGRPVMRGPQVDERGVEERPIERVRLQSDSGVDYRV